MNFLSNIKEWVPSAIKDHANQVTCQLSPLANVALARLPAPLSEKVRGTFTATMISTGIWKAPCSEAADFPTYVDSLVYDAQFPSANIVQISGIKITERNTDREEEIAQKLKEAAWPDSQLDRSVKQIGDYLSKAQILFFDEGIKRYQNENLDLIIFPSKLNPLPELKIAPTSHPGIFNIIFDQTFTVKNCKDGDLNGPIASIFVQLSFSYSWIDPKPPLECALKMSSLLDIPLSFELKNYVEMTIFPGEKPMLYLMDDGEEISIPVQLDKDFSRQAFFIGEKLFYKDQWDSNSDSKSMVKSIYAFTNQDKVLTENICKSLTQRTLADPTIEVFKNYQSDERQPKQILKPPLYRVYKEGEVTKLSAEAYFNLYDLSNDSFSDDHIKATTLINFATGHAHISYQPC